MKTPNTGRHSGFALLTALVLLFVLTIVGVAAMISTSLELRLSNNAVFQNRARETSESGRLAASAVLPEHTYERGWTGIDLPSGLNILDKNSNGSADSLYGGNEELSLDVSDPGALTTDMNFSVSADANGDNDVSDAVDSFTAAVKVYRSVTRLDQGSGTAMVAGYDGLGKGAAGGGAVSYYYVASEGTAPGGARAWTSADSRSRIFN